MSQQWKVNRRERRVNISMPVSMEVVNDQGEKQSLESQAENLSCNGFRIRLPGNELQTAQFRVGEEYVVRLSYYKQKVRGVVQVIWCNPEACGFRFIDHGGGWLIS